MSSLSLKISGRKFDFFNSFELNLAYNSIASTFSFEGLIFDEETKNLFKPLSYKECKVYMDDELLLTGTILNTSTSAENQDSLASISGYAKTGVLDDCNIPTSLYPLQSDKLTIKEIIEKLLKPFSLSLIVDSLAQSSVNTKFDKSTADSDQTIKSYINELTTQRNIILSHNENGNLLLTKLNLKQPSVATYIEGMPSTKISLSVDGQSMHSHITVQKQASIEVDVAGEQTLTNDLVTSYRPVVKQQTEGSNNETEDSVNSVLGSELRNIQLTIVTDRWKWTDGQKINIIKPNNIIDVKSPTNFINNLTRFFVESISYSGNQEGIIATINCVLPEVYSGNKPKNIFA